LRPKNRGKTLPVAKAKKVLITGAAGFIGFHLSQALCELGYEVTGIDNLNDYYDVALKKARLALVSRHQGFSFHKLELENKSAIELLFNQNKFDYVVNLAAQAGVRYSISNPDTFVQTNVVGFLNVLEGCRRSGVRHLIYASSSSVYGGNKQLPFSTHQNVDHPLSLYAATKKSNELMAHAYSSMFSLPTTGLRFFSVYGPYGRPDMALFKFTESILTGKPIDVFNHGKMRRDFTYVDDVVEAITKLIPKRPVTQSDYVDGDPSASFAPYRIYNIGNGTPIDLLRFIELIENKLGKSVDRNYLPMQDADVPEAAADVADLIEEIGFRPMTPIEVGVGRFIDWYLDYYKVKL
jgi:UDP-glucuronate 4-epimerase